MNDFFGELETKYMETDSKILSKYFRIIIQQV